MGVSLQSSPEGEKDGGEGGREGGKEGRREGVSKGGKEGVREEGMRGGASWQSPFQVPEAGVYLVQGSRRSSQTRQSS